MASEPRFGRIVGLWAFLFSLGLATIAPHLAVAGGATGATLSRRVAVLPMRDYRVLASDLLEVEASATFRNTDYSARAALDLSRHPGVLSVSPSAVTSKLTRDRSLDSVAQIAQARYRLGLEYFMGLSPARAVQSLREAARLYAESYRDLSAPKALADAWFLLGVSLLDAGDTVGAHLAMKRGFAVQPNRRFRVGLFSKAAERALQAALVDHLSTGQLNRPFGDKTRLRRLARRLNVMAVVSVSLSTRKNGIHLTAYRADVDRFDLDVALPLPNASTQIEAALSRWVACLPAPKRPRGTRTKRLSIRLDTAANYSFYLRQPTRRPFHSLGFGAGLARPVAPGLEWFVRLHMMTSLSDPYRDLLYTFNSVRAVTGVGFIIKRRGYRFWARPGIDVHALGRFVASTDAECKLFGEAHPLCNKSTIRDLEQNILVGFYLGLGAEIDLGHRFFVLGQLSGSAYIVPFSKTDDLNFPLALDFGLGYRF